MFSTNTNLKELFAQNQILVSWLIQAEGKLTGDAVVLRNIGKTCARNQDF